MTQVEMTSDLKVQLIRGCYADEYAIQAAQVSVRGANDPDLAISDGLDPERFIRALMNPRHGVPFEHTFFTFFVEVPIFVVRQWVKHRLSSMNEMSGRYTKLLPKFYTAPEDRPLVNIGTKMKPRMVPAESDVFEKMATSDMVAASFAWGLYENRLAKGVAEEYARIVLPLNVYTQFYWSLNGRSLLNFLERRVDSPDAHVPTHPQWEIDFAARQVEAEFARVMPITHAAFVAAGRVAP
jgi:thymidylate synthase (FAD)